MPLAKISDYLLRVRFNLIGRGRSKSLRVFESLKWGGCSRHWWWGKGGRRGLLMKLLSLSPFMVVLVDALICECVLSLQQCLIHLKTLRPEY